MSVRVMALVWDQSTAEPTDRLVLLAIADCANDSGTDAYPSMAKLVKKTGLHERSVQRAIKRLVELGELSVQTHAGPHGCNRYRVRLTPGAVPPPAQSHPGTESPWQDATPAQSRSTPGTVTPHPRQAAASTPGTAPPEPSFNHPLTVIEPSLPAVAALSVTQRSKRITDAYAAAEPMCKWPAVNGVVIKAIKAERWSDGEIHAALIRLANEGRSVTVETLRVELNGMPPRASPKGSTTDSRVGAALALAAELERQEIGS